MTYQAILLAAGCALALSSGCKSKEHVAPREERVHVRAPFVDVGVGAEGGTKVKAPFTNIDTQR